MTAVLADTHAIVWWLADDRAELSEAALSALADADESDGIFVSAITLLDLWYATQKRDRPITADQLSALDEAIADPAVNVHVLPVTAVDAARRGSRAGRSCATRSTDSSSRPRASAGWRS
ncbi:MAG TPA: PIN domain-containing protein [Acidimicrobiia bacterium]